MRATGVPDGFSRFSCGQCRAFLLLARWEESFTASRAHPGQVNRE